MIVGNEGGTGGGGGLVTVRETETETDAPDGLVTVGEI